jgi:hypothetical protein
MVKEKKRNENNLNEFSEDLLEEVKEGQKNTEEREKDVPKVIFYRKEMAKRSDKYG